MTPTTGQPPGQPSPASVDMANPQNVLAIAMRAEHAVSLVQSSVKQSLDVVVSRLDALAADQRETSRQVASVASQVHDFRSHSEGLARLARQIEAYADDAKEWREQHEKENRDVADRVTRFSGALWGFGLGLSLILSLGAYLLSQQFQAVRADRNALEASMNREIQYLRAEDVRLETRIQAVATEAKQTRALQ
jgi:cell division protein FtsB